MQQHGINHIATICHLCTDWSLLKGHICLCLVVYSTTILRETSCHHLQKPMDINIPKTRVMQILNVCKSISLPIRTLLYVTKTLMSEKYIHNLAKSYCIRYKQCFLQKQVFFYQTSRNKKLKECNILQGKHTILVHFSDQLWQFNPKQLFHNISITKITNAYFQGNLGRYHFRSKEKLINYKSQ